MIAATLIGLALFIVVLFLWTEDDHEEECECDECQAWRDTQC